MEYILTYFPEAFLFYNIHFVQSLVLVRTSRAYCVQDVVVDIVYIQMCVGHFIDLEDSTDDTKDSNSTCSQQVALACDNGAVYVMSNFSVCITQ